MKACSGQQILAAVDVHDSVLESRRLLTILAIGLTIVTFIAVVQDLIDSRINNYSFYFSESLLFKSFWVSFLPVLFFQLKFLGIYRPRSVLVNAAAVLVPTLTHVLLTPILITTASALLLSHTYSLRKTFSYTLAEDFYKALLVYGVCAIFFQFVIRRAGENPSAGERDARESADSKETSTARVDEDTIGSESLIVSIGRKYIPVSIGSIIYISASTPYVTIHLENEKYLHSESLKSIEAKLKGSGFVRVHKSTIVNLNKVRSFKSRLNGDYDVLLENGAEVRLSRNYVPDFKKRVGEAPQVDI